MLRSLALALALVSMVAWANASASEAADPLAHAQQCLGSPQRALELQAMQARGTQLPARTVTVPRNFHLALARLLKVARVPAHAQVRLVGVPGGRSASVQGAGTILLGSQLWQGERPLDDDEAAAVIAHELAHLEAADGQRRLCDALALGGDAHAPLSEATRAVHRTIWSGRYDLAIVMMQRNHRREFDADRRAGELLRAAGYAQESVQRMLLKVATEGGGDFSATHPALEERLANLANGAR